MSLFLIQTNTWGQVVRKDKITTRIFVVDCLLTDKANDFFEIYEYHDDWEYPIHNVYSNYYSVESHFYRCYTAVEWVNSNNEKVKPDISFIVGKTGWILNDCSFLNCSIDILEAEAVDDTTLPDILIEKKCWLIETSLDSINYESLGVTYNIEMISYLLARHNIEITYPPDFDIDSISGIWEALTYWRLQTTHPAYSKQIAELNLKLMNFLTQSHHSQDRQTINIILQAWHTQPQSEQKLSNIARYEKRLAQCLVIEPIQNKIATLKTLTKSRPLLAREQVELEILQGILAAQTEAEIETIISQIKATPTDAELRKILTAQAEARRSLIVDNNIEGI
jgi:hypothetical protein